jgi:hypothetical protein
LAIVPNAFPEAFPLKTLWGISVAAIVFCAVSSCWAAKNFVMPVAQAAQTYPAHDFHPNESVTIALDPYDSPEKDKIFSIHYRELGFMPIFVVITNNGNQPISLMNMSPTLVTSDHTKIMPASKEDIFRRLSRPSASVGRPFPWPKGVKGGVSKEAREEMDDSRFEAEAVEPHGTQAGFMFFDVSGISDPLAGAHFYVTGVRDANGRELMYFDVPLNNYLNSAQPK